MYHTPKVRKENANKRKITFNHIKIKIRLKFTDEEEEKKQFRELKSSHRICCYFFLFSAVLKRIEVMFVYVNNSMTEADNASKQK